MSISSLGIIRKNQRRLIRESFHSIDDHLNESLKQLINGLKNLLPLNEFESVANSFNDDMKNPMHDTLQRPNGTVLLFIEYTYR